MPDYLEIMYNKDEYAENKYPQKLCDYLIERFIQSCDTSLLDVGSGKGNHLVGFARRGLTVTGLDVRLECVDILKNFNVKKCNIETEQFPFEDETFDVIFSKSVLEHVSNADNFLEQIFRVLKKEGLVILMTPDWDSQHRFFWDDYTHVKPWTQKSIQNAMRIKGFRNVNCSLFRQLPILWKYPWLKIVCDIVSLLPNSFRWKDDKKEIFREFIRFSKEKMILAIGTK